MRLVYVFDVNTSAPEYVMRVPQFMASIICWFAWKFKLASWDYSKSIEGDIYYV